MKMYLQLIFTLLIIVGCQDQEQIALKAEAAKLHQENDELRNSQKEMERHIASVTGLINEVDDALDSIAKGTSGIVELTEHDELDIPIDTYSQSKNALVNIEVIEDYIVETQIKIRQLENRIENSGEQLRGLKEIISKQKARLEENQFEIAALKNRNSELINKVDSLQTRIESNKREIIAKNDTILRQSNRLHTAYFIIGTKSDLTKLGIVKTTKGLLIAGKKTFLRNDFSTLPFRQIDASKVTQIPISAQKKKVKVMTHQLINSYRLIESKDHTDLYILDPTAFWDSGQYLVIMID